MGNTVRQVTTNVPPNPRLGITGTWTPSFNAGKGVLQAVKTAAAESATWAVPTVQQRFGEVGGSRPHTVRLKCNIATAALSGAVTAQFFRTTVSGPGNIALATPINCTVTRSDGLTTQVSATDIEITATVLDLLKATATQGFDVDTSVPVPVVEGYFVFTFPTAATTVVTVYTSALVSDIISE
jgi:hypothetical protein